MVKLVVGTPCFGGIVSQGYLMSALRLMKQAPALGLELGFTTLGNDALIPRARSSIVASFLDDPLATHLLFVDADIAFEPSQVMRLMRLDKEIAAALYPVKTVDWNGVAARHPQSPETPEQAGLGYVGAFCQGDALRREGGFATAEYAGTGFLLIKRTAFARLIAAYPETRYKAIHNFMGKRESENFYALWDCMIDAESGYYLSEDFSFCRRWRAIGGEIWLDLASKLAHVGPHVFAGDTTARYAHLAVEQPSGKGSERIPERLQQVGVGA
ncbi:MAG TPA: hypothetical protein VMU42_10705 [Candidatus Sulfotelmatobacter sp.]|nr:hypothetical protein [Candidatus Sulfotelmatobacter sp.]